MSVKVILLGDSNVGKTSFVHQYVYGVALESQTPTIGAAMISKYVNTPKFKGYLHIWDTAGQERYRSLVPLYYRGTHIAIVIYDITNKTSFINAKLSALKVQNNDDVVIAMVGNKTDLTVFDDTVRVVEYSEGEKWAKEHEMLFFETSARTESVDFVFDALLPKQLWAENDSINLTMMKTPSKWGCC
ncbi:MAG: Rab family GTPase [Flavobacterium sp.]